ncbi:MAG: hypothetical protein IPH87_26975 [Anaerolineae bacterium]|nr:hypothetical protein [Anaerolineae bacterium]
MLTGYAPTVLVPTPEQDNNNQAQPYAVNLAQGQFNPTADFGYAPGPTVLKDSTIGNLVWVDRNADGLYQGGEPGIGNVTVDCGTTSTATAPRSVRFPGGHQTDEQQHHVGRQLPLQRRVPGRQLRGDRD